MSGIEVTRRQALSLVGGFGALSLGAAPIFHNRARLDLQVSVARVTTRSGVIHFELQDALEEPSIGELVVNLENHESGAIDPLFLTWDQNRKTRHVWEILDGESPLESGAEERYRIAAPSPEGEISVGYRAQLTVFDRGKQRWRSVHFEFGGKSRVD